MQSNLSNSSQRVQAALEAAGLQVDVIEMPRTTRTAEEAAQTIGCIVGQIAKSILFRGAVTGKPVLVIASGVNRINEKQIAKSAGERVEKGTAGFARSATGYAIGGIPPVGFRSHIETWIDEDLLKYGEVWAAAGTPNTVFRINPALLPLLTGGQVARII